MMQKKKYTGMRFDTLRVYGTKHRCGAGTESAVLNIFSEHFLYRMNIALGAGAWVLSGSGVNSNVISLQKNIETSILKRIRDGPFSREPELERPVILNRKWNRSRGGSFFRRMSQNQSRSKFSPLRIPVLKQKNSELGRANESSDLRQHKQKRTQNYATTNISRSSDSRTIFRGDENQTTGNENRPTPRFFQWGNEPSPKMSFLLGFHPLSFEDMKSYTNR